ncbi:MAG: cytochrome c oxidase subunit II [Acidimicrobiales bacterium]
MSEQAGTPGQPGAPDQPTAWRSEPHHFWRMIAIWVVLSIAGDLIFWFIAGPHVPPGDMAQAASDDQFDFNVLFMVALPVVLAVWTYAGYALVMWRARPGTPDPVGGPDARSNLKVNIAWISITSVLIMFAFIFGTVELIVTAGAGGGEGPNPVWTPTSKAILPIQVIAQQWKFTYRYPTFGGMETDNLIVPDGTTIAFHVTSLDVIHSFWAYQLGVKADANPEVDNVAYTTTKQTGSFTVRCSELCGLWHGAMFDYGKVVSKSQFEKWGTSTEHKQADNTKYLPPFAWTYSATANTTTGVTPSDTSGQAPYSKIQKYGATKAAQKVVTHQTTTPTTTGT